MTTLVTVIHVITCVVLVLVVLIQSGKGAEPSLNVRACLTKPYNKETLLNTLHDALHYQNDNKT